MIRHRDNERLAPGGMPTSHSRRRVLAAGAVVGGTAWIAPTVLTTPAAAQGSLPCTPFALDWTELATSIPSLNDLSAGYSFDASYGPDQLAATLTVTMSRSTGVSSGTCPDPSASGSGASCGSYGTGPLGGTPGAGGYLGLEMSSTAPGDYVELELVFSNPVSDLQFTLLDIDRSDGEWIDEVELVAELGGSPVTLTTFVASSSIEHTSVGPGDRFEPSATSPTTGIAGTSTAGNVALTYSGPVDRIVIRYTAGGGVEYQDIGITDLSGCV
jgi:hypothetical protein